jgi:predicted metal-dependent hydrolase
MVVMATMLGACAALVEYIVGSVGRRIPYDSGVPLFLPEPEQLSIVHADSELPVTFLRSARARRVSLRVDSARRRIVLTAPLRLSRAMAVGFAEAQAGWIAARLKRLPAHRPFLDGAEVPLFGVAHCIRHRPDARGTVWLEAQEIHIAGRAEHLPRRLRDWLMAELRRRLVPLVHAKAERVQRPVKKIGLRDGRSRWGSCGPGGSLSFSWRLVFAPPEVLDYLVAHEVAHLVHMNHSARFWAQARALCDGPMEPPQAWLKKNGEMLLQYGG